MVDAIIADDPTVLQCKVPPDCDKDDLAGALCSAVLLRSHRCIDMLVCIFGADPLYSYANRNSIYWAVDQQDLISLKLLVGSRDVSGSTTRSTELQRTWYDQRRTVDEALHIASWLGSVESVRALLGLGANPNTCYFYNDEFLLHCSALIVACLPPMSQRATSSSIQNSETIVRLLVDAGANVHRRCSTGRTPLHWAVAANLENSVTLLITAGADVGAQTAGTKQTPLMLAVSFDFVPLVNMLIAAGSCIDDFDGADCTALCYAIDKRNIPMAEHLLNIGASPDGAPIVNALTTPLIMATSSGSKAMIILLIRWGANVNRNSRTRNAFATAVNVNNFGIAHMLLKVGVHLEHANQLVSNQAKQILSKAGGHLSLLRLPEKLRLQELRKLEDEILQPRKLSDYVRLTIRSKISRATIAELQKLPLPSSLIRYLTFEELC